MDNRSSIEIKICEGCIHEFDKHEDCRRCADDREMHRRQMAAKDLDVEYRGIRLGDVYSQTRRV
jgi:hypothetical protein